MKLPQGYHLLHVNQQIFSLQEYQQARAWYFLALDNGKRYFERIFAVFLMQKLVSDFGLEKRKRMSTF